MRTPLRDSPSSAGVDPFKLSLATPAEAFTDAFLLGNGSLGATVYGRHTHEDIDLNLDTLWSGGPRHAARVPAGSVGELRDAIRREDHPRVDMLARGLQSGEWSQSYQPLGRLRWRWTESRGAYQRSLDLRAAEVVTNLGNDELLSFVSRPDDVLVACSNGRAASNLTWETPHPGSASWQHAEVGVTWLFAAGRAPSQCLPDYVDDSAPVRYTVTDDPPPGSGGGGMGWAVAVAIERESHGGTRLIIAGRTGFRGADLPPIIDPTELVAEAQRTVRNALRRSTRELRRRHNADISSLVERTELDLSANADPMASQVARYYNFGRYLLVSSSRPGTQAAALQGIWNVDSRPAWSGNYTTNINVQMNYWGVECAGLGELHEPLFTLIDTVAASGRSTARSIYSAPGSAVHHNTDVWGFAEPVSGEPVWANWPTALAWLAAHLTQHAVYNNASAFSQDRELPVLREAVLFLEAMLVEDGEGALVISPSTVPENTFFAHGEAYAVTAGGTLDQELVIEAFRRFISIARPDRGDGPLRERIAAKLDRVRHPRPRPDGPLEEWAGGRLPAEPGHRHFSHLYGVYPGSRITPTRTPDAFRAARLAFAERLDEGSGHTGWSAAWAVALAARFGDGDLARTTLKALLTDLSSASLLGLHPHPKWGPDGVFQIDANLGAVGAISELFIQSHDDALSLLPALPAAWSKGRLRGFRASAGCVVDLEWSDGVPVAATIRSPSRSFIVDIDRGCEVVLDVASGLAQATRLREPQSGARARWLVRGTQDGAATIRLQFRRVPSEHE